MNEIVEKNRLERAEARVTILEKMIENKTRELFIEKELHRQAHDYLEHLFEQVHSALFVFGLDSTVRMCNSTAASICGYDDICDILGKPASTLILSNDALSAMTDLATGERTAGYRGEVMLKASTGLKIPVLFSAQAVTREESGDIEIICVGHDIREKKELEAKLLQAQKLESIGELAAGIAHEINTPIQFVGDNTRFLQDAFKDLAPLFKFIEKIAATSPTDKADKAEAGELIQASDLEFLRDEIPKAIEQALDGLSRVTKIVRAMKEFAHPGTEQKQLVDINKMIESTCVVSKNEWKYVAELEFLPQTDLPLVPCLPAEFNQALLNLIVNAAHAIEERNSKSKRGKIVISTALVDSNCLITIADSGLGIPKEIQSRIFDPFFTTKAVGKGTGQGLAIVHSTVVEKHGGTISFESELGVGTTFNIVLPLGKSAESIKNQELV